MIIFKKIPLIQKIMIYFIFFSICSCTEFVGEIDVSAIKEKSDSENASSFETSANNSISGHNYVFADESVNNSSISYDESNQTLFLDSAGGVNPSGGFQGGGTGNKPIAALDGFNGVALSDFSLSFDYNQALDIPWINLLVDIDMDGIADHVFVPLSPSGGSFSFEGATDNFKVVCVPSCGTWSVNQYNLSDYPNAVIVNSIIADGGLPAHASSTAINGVLISTGSGSVDTAVRSSEVFNIRSNLD